MRTAILLAVIFVTPAHSVTIETVPVGHPGNAPQLNGMGRVDYEYRIGKYEVTNDQYVEFLNAKATGTDPLGLFEPYYMGSTTFRGGIDRYGPFGFYSYGSKPNMGNKPVNHATWYDAIRFINWLHNGQGNGDTETGAYTLEGGTPKPSNGPSVTRNPGAVWFMPNQDEWFKAAHYQPTDQGGDDDGYWFYPTRSNAAPTAATADSVGDVANPGANVANHNFGATWNGVQANVTTVGSAGPLSASYYGTFDQGGNVSEWNETPFMEGVSRGSRGGFYVSPSHALSYNSHGAVGAEFEGGGFRVATIAETCAVAGDYNCNSTVDVADYTLWRDNLGSDTSLTNDDTPGVGPDDYDRWKANFGNTAGAATRAPRPRGRSAVPEPAMCVLLAIPVAVAAGFFSRSSSSLKRTDNPR
jgi:formylglycine-generating enzyme required for sulfatase activity